MAALASSLPRRANALVWLWLSIALVAVDQWTKHIVLAHLQEGVPIPVVPGFLNWLIALTTMITPDPMNAATAYRLMKN